jgi:hypothetical protein
MRGIVVVATVAAGLCACSAGTLNGGGKDRGGDAPQALDGPRAADLVAETTAPGDAAGKDRSGGDVAAKDRPSTKDQPLPAKDKPTKDQPPLSKDKPPTSPDQPAKDSKPPAGDQGTGGGPTIAGCPVFPASSPWNTDISADPADPNSSAIIAAINANGGQYLHPDFSSTAGWNPPYGAGIPFVVVSASQPAVCMKFTYAGDSDPGPYPIPSNAPIEGGPSSTGDRHILVIDKDSCKLYETFSSYFSASTGCWNCGSGAVFDLKSTALRTDCWTSADAAGLPIFPGLVRHDEAVVAGQIKHALRVTFDTTRQAFIHPATHYASSSTDPNQPPMGLRLRLKASFNTSGYTGAAKVILTALQKYGMIVADNGSNWYISGAPDPGWDDDNLDTLKQVPGTAFEVVKVTTKVYTAADCP